MDPTHPHPTQTSDTTLANQQLELFVGLLPVHFVPRESAPQPEATPSVVGGLPAAPANPPLLPAHKGQRTRKTARRKLDLHVHLPVKDKQSLKELRDQSGLPMGILLSEIIRVGLPRVRDRIQRQAEL